MNNDLWSEIRRWDRKSKEWYQVKGLIWSALLDLHKRLRKLEHNTKAYPEEERTV